jgi:hypothetical protein
MTRPFRFGVVTPVQTELPAWRDRVGRIAGSGYSTLLMADVPRWQPAPGPTLAFAAALTDLRVGTWVYACPLRPAWHTAWEAHSLSVLTDGRFDFRVTRDVELGLHMPVIGDTVAPFMAPPGTDPAALRAADSLAILPDDPAAAAEEIQRRREEIGFSYFVFGAGSADALAPVVAELARHQARRAHEATRPMTRSRGRAQVGRPRARLPLADRPRSASASD